MQNQQGKLSYKVMIGFGVRGAGGKFPRKVWCYLWGGVLEDNLFE